MQIKISYKKTFLTGNLKGLTVDQAVSYDFNPKNDTVPRKAHSELFSAQVNKKELISVEGSKYLVSEVRAAVI